MVVLREARFALDVDVNLFVQDHGVVAWIDGSQCPWRVNLPEVSLRFSSYSHILVLNGSLPYCMHDDLDGDWTMVQTGVIAWIASRFLSMVAI